MDKIELGDEVKEKITGFTGIAVARTTWLTGCDRIAVRPRTLKKEGGVQDIETFDEAQLVILKRNVIKSESVQTKNNPGGPGPNPSKPSNMLK